MSTRALFVTYQHRCGCLETNGNPCCTRSSKSPGYSHICACSSDSGYTHLCLQEKLITKKTIFIYPDHWEITWGQSLFGIALTNTTVSVFLEAKRTLAHIGASGVKARLFRPTGVSACCTFIYICSKHIHRWWEGAAHSRYLLYTRKHEHTANQPGL